MIMFVPLSRRAALGQAAERARPVPRDGSDAQKSRRVKATLEIPDEVVRQHREVVDHALEVLARQWGLSDVELKVRAAKPGAPSGSSGAAQHALTVAGYSFPLRLEYM
jgi:hypothetical protein